jgi:hypothetical protein
MIVRGRRLFAGVALVAFLVLGPTLLVAAAPDPSPVVAQEESPYTPPEIQEVDTPDWLAALEPLARLPLWGQAAVLSAGVAGMFFVVPIVFRWVWRLGEDRQNGNGHRDLTFNGKHEEPH